jgi:hypothetical protein
MTITPEDLPDELVEMAAEQHWLHWQGNSPSRTWAEIVEKLPGQAAFHRAVTRAAIAAFLNGALTTGEATMHVGEDHPSFRTWYINQAKSEPEWDNQFRVLILRLPEGGK